MPRNPKRTVNGEVTVAPLAGDRKYTTAPAGEAVRAGGAAAFCCASISSGKANRRRPQNGVILRMGRPRLAFWWWAGWRAYYQVQAAVNAIDARALCNLRGTNPPRSL